MIIEGDDAKAVMAALPRGVRARMSMSLLQAEGGIRHFVQGALEAADAVDVDDDGALFRGDAPRADDVEAALKRFDAGFDDSDDGAKTVGKQLGDLLSREERMHALLAALQAAGKRLDVSIVGADEG